MNRSSAGSFDVRSAEGRDERCFTWASRSPQDINCSAIPGAINYREHDGVVHEIRVLKDGFEYQGRHYTSLSTIAREVTGTSWNGFLFFGLCSRKARKAGGRRLETGGRDA